MTKRHAGNTRVKRDHFDYLKGPKRQSEASTDAAAKAVSRFEVYTRHKDFKTFRKEQATGFVAHLSAERNARTKEPLSKATLLSTLAASLRANDVETNTQRSKLLIIGLNCF